MYEPLLLFNCQPEFDSVFEWFQKHQDHHQIKMVKISNGEYKFELWKLESAADTVCVLLTENE